MKYIFGYRLLPFMASPVACLPAKAGVTHLYIRSNDSARMRVLIISSSKASGQKQIVKQIPFQTSFI